MLAWGWLRDPYIPDRPDLWRTPAINYGNVLSTWKEEIETEKKNKTVIIKMPFFIVN